MPYTMMDMINKVKNTMYERGIFPTRSVLVGLSGGADSVALLHIMHSLSRVFGFKVYAAHVNHNLRGDAANNDEKFSKSFCESFGIQCFVKNADVKAVAKSNGISEEMAGRRVRYEFFSELMAEYDIEYTATAHHKNDNAETILMNFIRGSALGGLSGIPYKRDRYIRPMLDVMRDEIEAYCATNNLSYVTDLTNLDTVYTRNKIRNILIPEIERELNSNFSDTITSNADIISCDDEYLSGVTNEKYSAIVKNNTVDIAELLGEHKAISRRIIRKMVEDAISVTDVSSLVIENVYNLTKVGATGSMCDITKGISARIEYGKLIIGKTPEECDEFSYTVRVGEAKAIPELGCVITVERADTRENDGYEYFSFDNETEITITNRRSGDKFVPLGMTGTKTVKEYMINEKIPKHLRSRIGILRFGNDIAWIIGYRRDNRYKFNGSGIKVKVEAKT